ncbi:MAG: prolipoprotein diacylglyceryl transferase [Candidatus Berkelbacteria bacterium]
MYPILFKIGGVTIYSHGVMAIIGIVVALLIMFWLSKRAKLDNSVLIDNVIFTVLFGIIGARITYFVLYRDQFASFQEIFYLWQGGMVSYGGFILGGLAYCLLFYWQKAKVVRWLDILAIAFPLGLFFGRIGNILAGEYSGVPTSSAINLGGLVPVPAYEALLLVLIFSTCLVLIRRGAALKNGVWTLFVLGSYSLGRFIIDFWRDEPKLLSIFSLGQLVGLVIFVVCLILYIKISLTKESKR